MLDDYASTHMLPLAASQIKPYNENQRLEGGQMTETRERLESVQDASQRLAISTFTTRRLIKTKALRAVRVGKRILIPQSEVDRIVSEGTSARKGQRRKAELSAA
jgi:excisionase family DNA binding protein